MPLQTDTDFTLLCSDIATEYTFSLELTDTESGSKSLIVSEIKNVREPGKNAKEVHPDLVKPFVDALLTACGVEPSLKLWSETCTECLLSSFDPNSFLD